MKVITLAKTKELLGIDPGTPEENAAISAKIPYIDSIVKRIMNHRLNDQIIGDIVSGSAYVPVYSFYCGRTGINSPYPVDDLGEYIQIGQLITGPGIPPETYIEELYYNGDSSTDGTTTFNIPTVQLSAVATESTASARVFLGITIGLQPTIAKGIQYLINGTGTSLPSNSLASKSIGPVSKSYGSKDQEIDNRYGMPAWFVKAFPSYQRGH